MNKQSTYVARLNHYLKRNILLYDPIWCNKPLTQTKRSKKPSAPEKKTINLCHTSEKQGNRLTRRPATVVNFFQPFWSWKMFKTLCFSHFSSLGGIFQASSLCTAWANSKFRQYVFVKAKYVQSKSCGSAASLYKHIDYPYLYPYLSVWLSIYISKHTNVSVLCKVCTRYAKRNKRRACGLIATYAISKTQTIC